MGAVFRLTSWCAADWRGRFFNSAGDAVGEAGGASSAAAATDDKKAKPKRFCRKCNKSGGACCLVTTSISYAQTHTRTDDAGLAKITLKSGENEWFCEACFPASLMTPAIQQVPTESLGDDDDVLLLTSATDVCRATRKGCTGATSSLCH